MLRDVTRALREIARKENPRPVTEAKAKGISPEIQQHADKLAKMTDENQHSEALVYIAEKVLKDKRLTTMTKALLDLHMGIGAMSTGLGMVRNQDIWPRLDAMLKSKLSSEEYDAIHGSL